MKHMVITIGCEYGSGGPEIGEMLAKAYKIRYYDRDLIDQVVEKTGVDREKVEKADQSMSQMRYRFETKFGTRYANLIDTMFSIQFQAIEKIAEESSCVIIGRCSDYILKDRKDCLRIFIYAPEEVRIKNVMEKEGLSKREAKEKVKSSDEALHARYKYMTGTYRGDRHNREILLDSSMLGWEKTAEYLEDLIRLRFGVEKL